MDKQPDNRNHRQEGRLMKEPIILFGCGGHARSVLDILHTNKVKNKIITEKTEKSQENQGFSFNVKNEVLHQK